MALLVTGVVVGCTPGAMFDDESFEDHD